MADKKEARCSLCKKAIPLGADAVVLMLEQIPSRRDGLTKEYYLHSACTTRFMLQLTEFGPEEQQLDLPLHTPRPPLNLREILKTHR